MSKLPKANKDLGQHFLVDKNIIHKICHDFKDVDAIVEVGPGPAILTKTLATHNIDFYVIEKDLRFQEQLSEVVKAENIFFTDALAFNWHEFFENKQLNTKHCWLVSNLPYNVSVPLLIGFLQQAPIQSMTLMFQKEVGIKVIDIAGAVNDMGSLKALTQNYFQTSILCKVSPGAFSPPPKVDSIVISLKRKQNPVVSLSEFKYFEAFLRNLFQFKRKQLKTVCKSWLEAEKIGALFENAKIDPQRRAETLKLEEIYRLFRHLYPQSI